MDSVHSNIDVSFRGTSIMRILPIVNDNLNEDWITDKIRFFYDSITVQRILKPFFLVKFKKYYVSWLNAFFFVKLYFFNLLKFYFNKKKSFFLSAILFGELYNRQEIVLLRDFSNKLSFPFLKYCYNSAINFNSDLRYFYLFKNKLSTLIDEISTIKFYFLFCVNLRFESPIINLRIKQIFGTQVFLWGYLSNFNQEYIHLGTNTSYILFFLENLVILDNYFKSFFQSNFILGLNYVRYITDVLLFQFFFDYYFENSKNMSVDILHVNNLDIAVREFNLNNNDNRPV